MQMTLCFWQTVKGDARVVDGFYRMCVSKMQRINAGKSKMMVFERKKA